MDSRGQAPAGGKALRESFGKVETLILSKAQMEHYDASVGHSGCGVDFSDELIFFEIPEVNQKQERAEVVGWSCWTLSSS